MSPKNHKHGGWHKPQPVYTPIAKHDSILIPPKPTGPAESWWTKPYPSREAFDQAQQQRSREAGWGGASAPEPRT